MSTMHNAKVRFIAIIYLKSIIDAENAWKLIVKREKIATKIPIIVSTFA